VIKTKRWQNYYQLKMQAYGLSEYMEKNITTPIFTYLIQYGRIQKVETMAQHKVIKKGFIRLL
jgi:hypothetical protein